LKKGFTKNRKLLAGIVVIVLLLAGGMIVMQKSKKTEEDYYIMATSLPAEEVEQFAAEIKNDILEHKLGCIS